MGKRKGSDRLAPLLPSRLQHRESQLPSLEPLLALLAHCREEPGYAYSFTVQLDPGLR
jgi:hypothetical protein